MSITEIISLITTIGTLIGVIAAAFWGREVIKAKDVSIQTKDTLLDSLKVSQEEVLKAKEVQITNLKDAQQEVIKAKDTHIQSLDEKIEFLDKFSPDAIKKYYISVIEQFSDIANEKENRIKALDSEIIRLNSDVVELNGKISQMQVDNLILQQRLDEANEHISRYKEENHYLTREYDRQIRDLRALRNERDEILEDYKQNKSKIEKLQIRLRETELVNENLDAELRETNKRIDREVQKRENQELSDQNATLHALTDQVRISREFESQKLPSESILCPVCHLGIDEDSRFCPHCGNVIDDKV